MGEDMSVELYDLDHTIKELKKKISFDPDPFLFDVLQRLIVIRDNQQIVLVDKVIKNERADHRGGFKGFGIA